MTDPQIEKLLIVQDRDVALQKIEQELTRIPEKRAVIEARIKAEEERIETALTNLKEKEVRRSELDTEVKSREQAIIKFRNQQLEVKKNDEYRALTQQIELAENEISILEEKEISLMLEVDEDKAKFEKERAEIELRIKEQHRHIGILEEREVNLEASIVAAQNAVASIREEVDESYLSSYERVKKLCKRAPYVVEIVDHKCNGCHLRVSNEVARLALHAGEPHFCDQCARMVYA